MHRIALTVLIVGVAAALGACDTVPLRLPSLRAPAPVHVHEDAPQFTPYPADVERGEDWDIVVTQGRDHITLDNRTARTYSDLQLWINQQYAAHVDSLTIGAGNRIPLRAFVNEHGEHYPIPGLLTPDKRFPVLAVEAYNPADGKRHRLLARQ